MKRKPATDDKSPLLTYEEVADFARVSVRTVGRWACEGLVPVYRPPGSRPRMMRDDILKFYESHRVSPVGETAPVKA